MARVKERKAAEDASARAEQKAAERAAMLSLLQQWTIPIFLIGLLSYYLGRVYPTHASFVSIACTILCAGPHACRVSLVRRRLWQSRSVQLCWLNV